VFKVERETGIEPA